MKSKPEVEGLHLWKVWVKGVNEAYWVTTAARSVRIVEAKVISARRRNFGSKVEVEILQIRYKGTLDA